MAQLVNRAGCTLLGYCLSCTNHSKHGIGASSHGADADAADPSIVSPAHPPGRAHLIDAGELGSSPWQSREDPTEDGDQSLGAPQQGTFSSLPLWRYLGFIGELDQAPAPTSLSGALLVLGRSSA